MYSEEAPHQNPENAANAQEEKPVSVSKTDKKDIKTPEQAVVEKQIGEKEKKDIVKALKPAPVPTAEKDIKTPEQTEAEKQIGEKEKKDIVKALKPAPVPTAEKKAVVKKEKPKKQIGTRLKKEIVDLLNQSWVSGEKAVKKPVKKKVASGPATQISKVEKKAIISLLREQFDAQADHVQQEDKVDDIDYENLNKQELVELLEETVEEKNVSAIRARVGSINKAFHRLNKEDKENALQEFVAGGGNEAEYNATDDPLEQRFRKAFNQYKHNKAKYGEEVEKQKIQNLASKNEILGELKTLIDSEETLKKTYDEFNRLQDRWKEIGMVPAGELNNLWQNYHFLVEMFFDKVRINKELRDLDMKKNQEQKIELCEKAEELILEKSIIKSFKLLQQYHDEWREIGPVPSEYREQLWERFKAATDKINERRREHYKVLQEDQERNYETKTALCEKAEEMLPQEELSLNEWQKKTKEINELFKVWKSIGRAGKAKNDEIWFRFKAALDAFFNTKKEFLNKLKDQQMNNLNMKIDLCVRAEAIKDSEDWKKTTNDLIRFQKEWKNIGPVPRRQSEKVWRRFRSACDEFFNRKSAHFKNLHGQEDDNLKAKKALLKEISAFAISDNKSKNMEALKSFQRQWMEIGHVPFKEKEAIQQEYRKAIDALIDKMDINKNELSNTGFKNKIEMLKNDPDADWRLRKERNFLSGKISKLKEDVALWENNIGFFSSSKQSEVLRKEFEKKIDTAKKEIESLESRIKLINED